MGSPLDTWKFLVGAWKGSSKGQFGETGTVETIASFSLEPGDRFLLGRGEAACEGRLLNRTVSVMFHDPTAGRLKRKTFFSYGFVNNETECESAPDLVRFDVAMEPHPKQFEGMRWRSYLRKLSDTEIATGLEAAKAEGPFESYGETVLKRIR